MGLTSLATRWVVQLLLIGAHIAGLLLFFRGFFPSKVVLPGFGNFHNGASPFAERGKPQFDKVIVMVVDAMRADFCYSQEHSHMTFLHELINDGKAVPFTGFSHPPTVTLPRLKGITTGGTPNFLDAILNVADDKDQSQGLLSQDSWIYQYKKLGKSINFYGDDTWLKLFPGQFDKVEGTNSFFVSDFTEVDLNVTRHLTEELDRQQSRWDGLILHYLGLDHIGHKGGPNSVFMKPKQEEMDSVLRRLYEYAETSQKRKESVLIVLMGDHGMNEIGNHGASSVGETNAALLFISPKFNHKNEQKAPLADSPDYSYYSSVSQIDLVPTLAGLLNFPIPKNSLGIIIRELLELWPSEKQKLAILMENCNQFMDLFSAKHDKLEHLDVWEKWSQLQDSKVVSSIDDHFDFLLKVQDILASAATNYNYDDMWTGFALTVVSAVVTLITFNSYFLKQSENSFKLAQYFQLFAIVYSLHFHGSSLIEEEHQLWWFFTVLSFVYLAFTCFVLNRTNAFYWSLIFIGIRIIRSWNNSGQKYSSSNTISYYLLNENSDLLWALNLITYLVTTVAIFAQGRIVECLSILNDSQGRNSDFQQAGNLLSFVLIFVASSISFLFKVCQYYNDGYDVPGWLNFLFKWVLSSYDVDIKSLNDPDFKFQLQDLNILIARLSGYFILGILGLRIVAGKIKKLSSGIITDMINISTLYLLQQSKYENIPMFLTFMLIKFAFTKLVVSVQVKGVDIDQLIAICAIFTICMQNLSFFCLGNTNLLATVDLSNAYNGIKSYDVIPVGVLTFLSNFVAPVYWSLSGLQIFFEPSRVLFNSELASKDLINFLFLRKSVFLVKSNVTLVFYAIAAVNLLGSCINLRFHLFIWTVFSPKLLYFASWSVLVNFFVDLVVAFVILFIFY